nr:MAG TPA: hypothetical protein [Caudoviricetes sp.]
MIIFIFATLTVITFQHIKPAKEDFCPPLLALS